MTRKRTKRDLQHTAVHEAAHAVIARRLDLSASEATIISDYDEGTAGSHITLDQYETLRLWKKAGILWRSEHTFRLGRILDLMAGREAETEILGRATPGDSEDRREIDWIMHCEGIPSETEPRLRRFARALVKRHRAAIERVAAALIEHKHLSGEQIDEILEAFPSTSHAHKRAEREERSFIDSLRQDLV